MRIQELDFSVDILKVLPWQSDSSTNLRSLLDKKALWYQNNQSKFWSDWERDVFNLYTANKFGLNVWSIILELPLYSNESQVSPPDYPAFGFADFGLNFDNSNFATDRSLITNLTIEQRRQLLILRWRNITGSGTMSDINKTVFDVFGGIVYVLDGLNMELQYIFLEVLSDTMMTLLKDYDILPRPSGVKINILVKPTDVFGFDPYGINFDQLHSQFGSTK
ncbi:structural protein [Yersinia phage vB_YenM_P744]